MKSIVLIHFLAILLLFFRQTGHAQPYLLEAESGKLTSVQKSTTNPGFSGTGYVTGLTSDGSRIELTFSATAGLFSAFLGFATPGGAKGYEVEINGIKSSGMLPETGKTFSKAGMGKVELKTGDNTVVVKKGWGWFDVDYVLFETATIPELLPVPDTLIDGQASSQTRSLHRFLRAHYGKKILSGQQDEGDLDYVKSVTGKTPAVGHFDFMDYSPSRIQFGANPNGNTEKMIAWAKRTNGLVSISWHWNAPTDLINLPPDKLWWSGFYTRATTFDIKAVLADPGGSRYQLLLRDMDAIAVQLKKFQAAGIPVLWRPLHEAAGGWFWWGAKGSQPFIELWRLMVSRLRDHHGIHNLIWVYTTGDQSWYPGDEFVDIVSHDIYTDKGSPMSGQWDETFVHFNGKKLVTLSESGTLPVPAKIPAYGTWWSYFSLWSGDFIRKIPISEVKAVYSHPLIMNAEDLPDWKNYSSVELPPSVPSEIRLKNYPNPFNPGTKLVISSPTSQDLKVTISDILGRTIQEMGLKRFAAGENEVILNGSSWSSGLYFVRVEGGTSTAIQKIILMR